MSVSTTTTTTAAAVTTTMFANGRERLVHFDNECVIIPEPERRRARPKITTKSYSLPLWKRRVSSGVQQQAEELDAPIEDHIVVKVPLPR
jgi:hypothetical protein